MPATTRNPRAIKRLIIEPNQGVSGSGIPTERVLLVNADGTPFTGGGGGGGGGGDMFRSFYDSNGDGIVNGADTVPWAGVSNRPTNFPTNTANIGDATTIGRDILKATDGAAVRALIGAGTGPGGGGSTTVAWADVVNKPATFPSEWSIVANKPTVFPTNAANIGDASTIGRQVLAANDAASIRTIIGVTSGGGGGSTTVAWGDITGRPSVFQTDTASISDATTFTRSFIQSTDAVTARTNLGVLAASSTYTRSEVNNLLAGQNQISELTDVALSSPITGQSLVWNGTSWVNQTVSGDGGSGSVAWNDILGRPSVFPTNTANIGDATVFGRSLIQASDASASRTLLGVPATATVYSRTEIDNLLSAQNQVSELTDVTITSPISGQSLVWDGSRWVNQTVSGGGDGGGGSVTWNDILGRPSVFSTNAANITDATTFSRSLITASDAVASRTLLGVPASTSVYNRAEVDGLLAAQDQISEMGDVTIVAPVSGQSLIYNGTQWANGLPLIDWSAVTGKPSVFSTDAVNITDATTFSRDLIRATDAAATRTLLDVPATSAVYSRIQTDALLSARDQLTELTDVTIASPTTGQSLVFNGTQWVNQTISSGGGGEWASITNKPTTFPTDTANISDATIFSRSLIAAPDAIASRTLLEVYSIVDVDAALATKASNFAQLSDINVIAPQNGQYLGYDSVSGKWINRTLPNTIAVPGEQNLTNIQYDTQNRVQSYQLNGLPFTITYTATTTIISGNSRTRTITYDSQGRVTSDVTV